MSALTGILIVVALAVGFAAALVLERRRRAHALNGRERVRRIAFPFTGEGPSEQVLAAALRLARAEDATLLPVYLALVPLRLAVEVPLQAECDVAFGLLEAIEQRAARAGVPVDARIERGRTVRHALRELIALRPARAVQPASAADLSRSPGDRSLGSGPLTLHAPVSRAKARAEPGEVAPAKPSAT